MRSGRVAAFHVTCGFSARDEICVRGRAVLFNYPVLHEVLAPVKVKVDHPRLAPDVQVFLAAAASLSPAVRQFEQYGIHSPFAFDGTFPDVRVSKHHGREMDGDMSVGRFDERVDPYIGEIDAFSSRVICSTVHSFRRRAPQRHFETRAIVRQRVEREVVLSVAQRVAHICDGCSVLCYVRFFLL